MTGALCQPTRGLLQRSPGTIALSNQINQRVASWHVARHFAHPTLGVLDGSWQITAQTIEPHSRFTEQRQVPRHFQMGQMLYGFLPASHAGQEWNDESQQFRHTTMLGQRLGASGEGAIRVPPFFQGSDPVNPSPNGSRRAAELPHPTLEPGKTLFFPVVPRQGIAIGKRIVLVAGGLAGGNAKTQQSLLHIPLVPTEVAKYVPAVRRQRLAPDESMEQGTSVLTRLS